MRRGTETTYDEDVEDDDKIVELLMWSIKLLAQIKCCSYEEDDTLLERDRLGSAVVVVVVDDLCSCQ